MPILETRCGGGLPRTPREGAEPPSNPPKGGEVSPLPPSHGPKPFTERKEENMGCKGSVHRSARLAAGKSCPFLKLVAGEASPAPPGRGLCPLPTLLKGALPPRPPKGGRYPPYPPLKGRDSAKSKGQNKATTRAEKSSTHTRGRRPKAACAKQSSLPSFLRKKAGGEMYVHYWE